MYDNRIIVSSNHTSGTVFPPRLKACTGVKSQVYTVQYHPLCVKILSRL